MTIVRVVEYTDLDGENHTKDFENASDAVRFFMMVTSERLVKKAALYDKLPILNSNTQRKQTKLCAM